MKRNALVFLLTIGVASLAFGATEPISMAGCDQILSQMKKQLPVKIDEITVRTGAKCVPGKTKPAMLILLDSIRSDSSVNEWKVALNSNEGQAKLKSLMCSTDGYNKFLPYMDVGQQLTVNGVVIATVFATQKECASFSTR